MFLIDLFNTILYRPLFNVLILFYQYLPGHDFGIAIIVLTILIRLILWPSMTKSIVSQKRLSQLQPKLKEIQKKYKGDLKRQNKETMELYKKEKINPMSGCLPLLIQLPILIALFQVFIKGFQPEQMTQLYSFVHFSGTMNPYFLGILNLSLPSGVIAVFAGIFQFFQTKTQTPKVPKKQEDSTFKFSQIFQKQMTYFFPIITVFFLLRLPAAIGLYWMITSIFSIIQQRFVSIK